MILIDVFFVTFVANSPRTGSSLSISYYFPLISCDESSKVNLSM
jgi:hypothetical protein